jgi:hypothetical protein
MGLRITREQMENERMTEQFLHERYIQYKCKCACEQHCGHSCLTEDCDCTECNCKKCEDKDKNKNIQKGYN